MNKQLLVTGAVVVVAGIVSGNLWLGLRSERLLNAKLTSQLADRTVVAQVAMPAAPPPTTQAKTASPPPPTCTPATQVSGMTRIQEDAMNMQIKASTSGILDGALLAATAGVSEQDLLKNPEYRKAEVLQLRMKLSQSNPGLAEAVGLSEKDTARLFEAMAEDQLKRTAEMAAMRASGAPTASVLNSVMQRSPAEDPVRITLGEEKYAKYQDYTRNVRPALVQVAGIGSMLTSVGQPLNELQARNMASAMLAEQQRQLQAPVAATRTAAPRGIVDMLEESANRQEESNRRILESVTPILNTAQLEAMRKQFDQEAATRRQTLESTRQREAGRPTPVPAAPASPR
jgi:hypothetical protein